MPAARASCWRSWRAATALVACVSGRRAAEARQMVGLDSLAYVGNHGLERLEPGAEEPALDPAIAAARRARPAFAAERYTPELRAARRHARGQGLDLVLPLARRRRRGRGPRGAGAGRRRPRTTQGLDPHWGRKVLEIRPTARGRQGHRGRGACSQAAGSRCALRRRRHDRPRRVPAAARAARRRARSSGAVCVGVRRPRGPAAIVDEADLVVEGTDGFLRAARDRWPPDGSLMRYTDFLKSTVLLAAGEATALAVVTIAVAAAAGRHGHDHLRLAWWAVAAVIGAWLGRRPETTTRASASLLAEARTSQHAARDPAGGGAAQPAVAARPCRPCWPPASSWLFPQFAAVVAGGAILVALAWRKQERGGDRDRGARRRALLRRARPRRSARSS